MPVYVEIQITNVRKTGAGTQFLVPIPGGVLMLKPLAINCWAVSRMVTRVSKVAGVIPINIPSGR
jgi:hypothetical protein